MARHQSRTARPSIGCNALLALVLLVAQALLAVHALDHLATDSGESCDVCLAGSNLGHAHVNALPPSMPAAASACQAPRPARESAEQPSPTPCQRAPPPHLRTV
jgi:hypothetical protein